MFGTSIDCIMGTSFWVRGTKTPGALNSVLLGGMCMSGMECRSGGLKNYFFFFLQKNKVYGTENFSFNI